MKLLKRSILFFILTISTFSLVQAKDLITDLVVSDPLIFEEEQGVNQFASIVETDDSGYAMIGHYREKGMEYSGYIYSYDKDDNLKWVYKSSKFLKPTNMEYTSDGGFVYAARGMTTDDAYIVKVDRDGKEEWVKSFNKHKYNYSRNVVKHLDGYVALMMCSGGREDDTGYKYIVRLNKDGKQDWIKEFKGDEDQGYWIIKSNSEGEIFLMGSAKNSMGALIEKLTKDGDLLWRDIIKTEQYKMGFYEGIPQDDGGILLIGDISSDFQTIKVQGKSDGVISKYNGDGQRLWLKAIGSKAADTLYNISEMDNGNYIICGEVDGIKQKKGDYDLKGIIIITDYEGNQLYFKNLDENHTRFYDISKAGENRYRGVGFQSASVMSGTYPLIVDLEKKSTVVKTSQISVSVNNKAVSFDVAPVIVDGHTLVPVKTMFNAMGEDVLWDTDLKMIISIVSGKVMVLRLDDKTAEIDDQKVELNIAPKIINGKVMVPIRIVKDMFDCKLEWDSINRIIRITK